MLMFGIRSLHFPHDKKNIESSSYFPFTSNEYIHVSFFHYVSGTVDYFQKYAWERKLEVCAAHSKINI